MKKIMVLAVVIAALLFGSYYGMGLVTERTLKKNIVVINSSSGIFIDVKNYNRGFFASNALLDWHLHIPQHVNKTQDGQSNVVPAEDYNFQMPIEVQHGPVIFSGKGIHFGLGLAHSHVAIPESYVAQFSALFSDQSIKPVLDFNLFVSYLNNSRLKIKIPPFKLFAKQGTDQVDWKGLDGDVNLSSNMGNISARFNIDGLNVSKDKTKAVMGKVISDLNLNKSTKGLYLGEASLQLPSLLVTDSANAKRFEIQSCQLQSGSSVEQDLFNSYFKMSLAKVVAEEKTYGPFAFEILIKNLDANVLAEINDQMNHVQQGSEADRQKALFAIVPELPKLLSQGAQLEISKFSLVMPEGNLDGNLSISIPKGNTGNAFQLIQKIQGQAQIKLPVAVVRNLLMVNIRKDVQHSSSLQQTMTEEINKTNAPTSAPVASNAPSDATHPVAPKDTVVAEAGVVVTPSTVSAPLTAEQQDAEVLAKTNQKLSALEQAGLLVVQDKNYVIDFNLTQGQLSINGKPFSQSMFQF